jgi:hypothetical protein
MTVVYRQVLQNEPDVTTPTNKTTIQVQSQNLANSNDPSNDQSDWYAILGILKHQKLKGKDWYLVSWQGSDKTSWVKREDVSEVAIEEFNATNQPNKRKRS